MPAQARSDFEEALKALAASGVPWSTPVSFRGYAGAGSIGKTAERISVQSLETMDRQLRDANVMVFRLGVSSDGRTTQFALVRAPTSISEFFLVDAQLFAEAPDTYIPRATYQDLYPFQLLGSLVEVGAVNLSIASGLLAEALELDEPAPRIAPAKGKSVYSFDVSPHAEYDVSWRHNEGQVEIDTVLFARRRGRWTLFVIEAKHGQGGPRSLSKAKLAYAVLAIAPKVPPDVPIVPVYMRSAEREDRVCVDIAECEIADPRRGPCPVASVRPTNIRRYSMPFHFRADHR